MSVLKLEVSTTIEMSNYRDNPDWYSGREAECYWRLRAFIMSQIVPQTAGPRLGYSRFTDVGQWPGQFDQINYGIYQDLPPGDVFSYVQGFRGYYSLTVGGVSGVVWDKGGVAVKIHVGGNTYPAGSGSAWLNWGIVVPDYITARSFSIEDNPPSVDVREVGPFYERDYMTLARDVEITGWAG